MNLTKHFELEEFLVSETASRLGIDNSPTPEVMTNLMRLAIILEDVRELLGKPIIITSGYRSPALNAAVPGSSKTSAHRHGLAVDFIAPSYGSPLDVSIAISGSDIQYDQLIHEGGRWVHLGLAKPGSTARLQKLTARFPGPKFEVGLVEV